MILTLHKNASKIVCNLCFRSLPHKKFTFVGKRRPTLIHDTGGILPVLTLKEGEKFNNADVHICKDCASIVYYFLEDNGLY